MRQERTYILFLPVLLLFAACTNRSSPKSPYHTLNEAVQARDVRAVRHLIASGVDVNAFDTSREIPPLLNAVVQEKLEIAKVLLEAGADPDAALPASFLDTLVEAAKTGDATALSWIRQHGVTTVEEFIHGRAYELYKNSPSQTTALWSAASKNQIEAARLLLQYNANPNATSTGGTTPLHAAALLGNDEVAALLIQANADVNALDDNQTTPLTTAAGAGHIQVMGILLTAGADPFLHGENANTPADWAAARGRIESLELLFQHGVGVNQKGIREMAPLHHAAHNGNLALTTWLLDLGADPNAICDRGFTPLHWAAYLGRADIVKALLAKGADPTIRSARGKLPADLARQGNYDEIADFLVWLEGD